MPKRREVLPSLSQGKTVLYMVHGTQVRLQVGCVTYSGTSTSDKRYRASSDTRGMPRILSPSAAALRLYREKRRVKKARQRAAIGVTEQWVRLGNLFGPGPTANANTHILAAHI